LDTVRHTLRRCCETEKSHEAIFSLKYRFLRDLWKV